MKLDLNHEEVLAICRALLASIHEMEVYAEGCEKRDMEDDAKFWRERAEEYRKAYEAVEAQREKAADAL